MSAIPMQQPAYQGEWTLPSRGVVAILSFIAAESAIFTIFVASYIYFIGRSTYGPTPAVLRTPIFNTVCLLSSSVTIWLAEHSLKRSAVKSFIAFWSVTFLLGAIFLFGTAREWERLIYHDGLTVRSNVFGTTYYSLVGLHASHVTVGLLLIFVVALLAFAGRVGHEHFERIRVLSFYWHFVDVVWIVVFTVVYVVGR